MSTNLKTILISLTVAVAAIFTYVQVDKYLEAKKEAETEFKDGKKLVSSASANAENVLRVEYEDSNITFNELFDKVDEAVKEADKAIIFVSSSEIDDGWKKSAIAYLTASQDALRAMRSKYQKSLDFSSHLDFVKDRLEDYRTSPYNEYSDAADRQRLKRYSEELDEKNAAVNAANLEYYNSIKKLESAWKANNQSIGKEIMIKKDVIDKVEKKLTPTPVKP
ncbi:hypothetical protein FJQ54_14285 [Sandaracinobacter neustonicus]|uniref:Uncharacterized protein n=1 Tax=Sandaracinobacter neustonicus TaxID=1715348 RepID=A0A501XFX3_9SPHN|nr:hypothetical protein [Sandaracinobacter neustonicus]TPE59227.1 hypothetical protein FJQ54_14285 [Sandaracinobacter neustonicus]